MLQLCTATDLCSKPSFVFQFSGLVHPRHELTDMFTLLERLLHHMCTPISELTKLTCNYLYLQRSPVKQTEHAQYAADFQDLPRYVQLRAVQILRMHVMGNVRQRIEAGHRDFVNEIRVCTCLFLGFPSLKVINTLAVTI